MSNWEFYIEEHIQMERRYMEALDAVMHRTGKDIVTEKVVQNAISWMLKRYKIEHQAEYRIGQNSMMRVDLAGNDWIMEVKLGNQNIVGGIGQCLHYSNVSKKSFMFLAVHDSKRIDFELIATADSHDIVLCPAWMAANCVLDLTRLPEQKE